jgi:hypothetical protein
MMEAFRRRPRSSEEQTKNVKDFKGEVEDKLKPEWRERKYKHVMFSLSRDTKFSKVIHKLIFDKEPQSLNETDVFIGLRVPSSESPMVYDEVREKLDQLARDYCGHEVEEPINIGPPFFAFMFIAPGRASGDDVSEEKKSNYLLYVYAF